MDNLSGFAPSPLAPRLPSLSSTGEELSVLNCSLSQETFRFIGNASAKIGTKGFYLILFSILIIFSVILMKISSTE